MADLIRKEEGVLESKPVDPFEGIELSKDATDQLFAETVGEGLVGALAGLVGLDKIWDGMNSYQEKVEKARLYILLTEFKNKYDDIEVFKNGLTRLLTTPSGMHLFQKIVRIGNAHMADTNYLKTLAQVLKKISDSDFEELFEEHNYVLSQVEKLTPQALLLLGDSANWPGISFASTTTSGITSGSGWDSSFATLYSNRKRTPDEKVRNRITHAINEIKNNNLIELRHDHLPLTSVGEEVTRYLR